MALTTTITLTDNFQEQITFNNAYIKVYKVQATKDAAVATVLIFREKDGDFLSDKFVEFSPELDPGENHIKQAYEYLKTLPEFADATDC